MYQLEQKTKFIKIDPKDKTNQLPPLVFKEESAESNWIAVGGKGKELPPDIKDKSIEELVELGAKPVGDLGFSVSDLGNVTFDEGP